MNELVVIVEGPTEQTFIRDQLAGNLAMHGVNAWSVLPGRRRNHGGVEHWEIAKQDIIRTLKERRYCSTMFDYYGLPTDWPGRSEASRKPWNERASHVEQRIHAEIVAAMGVKFDPSYFIPYIQLHEFEALAFANTQTLASVLSPIARCSAEILANTLAEILTEAGHPEAIDDGYETCPSRQITKLVPAYRKTTQGPIATNRIGLETLRERCDHFAEWVDRLEAIGSTV